MRTASLLVGLSLLLPIRVVAQETREERLNRQIWETQDQIEQLEGRLEDLKAMPVEFAGALIALDLDGSPRNPSAAQLLKLLSEKVEGLKQGKTAAEAKHAQAVEFAKTAPAEALAEARRVELFAQQRVEMLARMISDSEADSEFLKKTDTRGGQALIERKRAYAEDAIGFLRKQKKFLEDSRN